MQSSNSMDWAAAFDLHGKAIPASPLDGEALSGSGVTLGRHGGKEQPGILGIQHANISRQHAKLKLAGDGSLLIVDLGSTNGTFINGQQLTPHTPYAITPDDIVHVSKVEMKIRFPHAEEPAEDPAGGWESEDRTYVVESEVRNENTVVDTVLIDIDVAAEGAHVPAPSERLIEGILTFGARQPLISILFILLFSGLALWGALGLKVDTSYDSLFSKEDPDYIPFTEVVNEFGSDNITLIYLKHPELFEQSRLAKIENLTFALQDLDFVEKSESLFTALHIRDADGSLDLRPLMDFTPESAEEIAEIKENALFSPLMRDIVISEDGGVTALVVTSDATQSGPEFARMVHETFATEIAKLEGDFESVFQVGPPRLNVDIAQGMVSDVTLISPLSTLVLIVSIVLFLRTGVAALLPLATAGISIFWTLGFMGAADIPLNLLTAILPALVIVIGSTEDTHMLSEYLDGVHESGGKRMDAIRFMAVHVGLPIFITSFTTTVGFLSNGLSDIALIRDFGMASSFAMVSNLLATVLVLPLLLRFFGPTKVKSKVAEDDIEITNDEGGDNGHQKFGGLLRFIEGASDRHEGKIILLTVLVVALCAWASTQVRVSNDPISYFKAGSPIKSDANTLHEDLAGMQVFYVTLTAPEGRDFHDPELLKMAESLQLRMVSEGRFDRVVTIIDHLALVHQEMNGGNTGLFKVPDTRELVEQYLLLFQRKDIDRYISSDGQRINFMVRHNLTDSWDLNRELDRVKLMASEELSADLQYFLSGKNLLINRAAETLFTSQVTSLALLVGIIFIIMSLLFSSAMAGILSLVPNLIPIAVLFGTMGFLGIPLNPGTAIVAVIAVGIAIDDTIHLLSRYNGLCRINPDQVWATREAVRAEALPVISTSLSLAAGFAVLSFSQFEIVAQFGLLSALTMLVAMITDLLITPILLKRIRLVGIWDIISIKIYREDILFNSPVFKGMTKFQIRKAILLSRLREYQPGEILFKEGESGDNMYLILSGTAEILKREDGRKKLIARLAAGHVFGELGYMGAAQRNATVRASRVEPMQVLEMNAEKVRNSMRFYPWTHLKLQRNLNNILSDRL